MRWRWPCSPVHGGWWRKPYGSFHPGCGLSSSGTDRPRETTDVNKAASIPEVEDRRRAPAEASAIRSWLAILGPPAFFVVVTIVMTWPLGLHAGGSVGGQIGDKIGRAH